MEQKKRRKFSFSFFVLFTDKQWIGVNIDIFFHVKQVIGSDKKWYALYVQPRKEKVVDRELTKRGYESYLPLRKELHQWKDRKKMVECPLFNSYVFVRIFENQQWDVLQVPGAGRFVWFGGRPAAVPDYQIESVKILLERSVDFDLENEYIEKGDLVRIEGGNFAGLTGMVKYCDNGPKFVVAIDSIGINLTVSVDRKDLEKMKNVKNK